MARSEPKGELWVKDYMTPERLQILRAADRALKELRRREILTGKTLLDDVEDRLGRLAETPASVVLVLQRFYWTTRAYHDYCVDDFAGARQALDQAHQAVAAAIEIAPFLLPLAYHCHEFRLQRARVARTQNHLSEMAGHLQEVRAMLEDRTPLCILSDGRPIDLSAVTGFYRGIPSLDPVELESLRVFFDEEYRRDRTTRLLMSLYVLPGFVIPYP